ncbi:hypothetical protein GCM10010331_21770 [Streptomyces xanthochromogenes]|nr:hypothetical protein GCM10010331_21770 [Streptomyces xanthochromogenes]
MIGNCDEVTYDMEAIRWKMPGRRGWARSRIRRGEAGAAGARGGEKGGLGQR